MGYQVYWNSDNQRWQGYGVPAECDYIECYEPIDRGMGWQCESSKCRCEMFYCVNHHHMKHDDFAIEPKGETEEWIRHILKDPSWKEFRKDKPEIVQHYMEMLEDM